MSRFIYICYFALIVLGTGRGYAQAPVSGPDTQGLSVEQRLARMERILEGQGLLDMMQQLQQLQRDINMLRGELETQNYNLEQLTRRQRDLYTDIDQRMQRLEGGGQPQEEVPSFTLGGDTSGEPPLETLTRVPTYNEPGAAVRSDNALQVETLDNRPARQPRSVTGTSPSGLEPTETFRSSNDEEPAANEGSPVAAIPAGPADPVQLQAEYQQAFNLLRQSQYDSAIRAFQEFLAIHPNDRYSDNAQYWLAEAYYVKRDFAQALNEYNNVVENFPQSQKVNDALLKTGFTLHELGRLDEARSRLQELMEKQPGTTIARLADERLKLINSANPNTPPASN